VCSAKDCKFAVAGRELALVIDAWPALTAEQRQRVLRLVDAVLPSGSIRGDTEV
jgi:hypothetical protein